MASEALARIPFVVVVGLLGAAALGVIVLGVELKLGIWSLVLLAIPAAVAVYYVAQFPSDAWGSAAPQPHAWVADSPAEPFDDPVEEADRIASTPAEADAPPSSDPTRDP